MLRAVVHGVIAVLSFLLVGTLLRAAAGLPRCGLLRDKLLYFEAHKDSYDILFFGSSRIYRGIIPTRFDSELAKAGFPVRSFNFGIAGMDSHEANAVLRRVLAMKPARLRWVVVEPGRWDPAIPPANRFKRRAIFWHDAPETLSAIRSTLYLDQSLATRADLVLTHTLHGAARLLAAGRGPDLVRSLADPGTARIDQPRALAGQGFETYHQRAYQTHEGRRSFLTHLDRYRAMVRRLSAANAQAASPASSHLAALAAQIAMVRRAGAEPVYLVTPSPQATPELFHLHRDQRFPVLLAFNRPHEYPELFAVERRFDREHLTAEGAERLTRLVAARFAAEAVPRATFERAAATHARP